ncbi:MAG: extracellular solute-binding protein [Chloroflexi bacterium]|nr:extracellular solute-binding protein [Chloroflexota bacterium]
MKHRSIAFSIFSILVLCSMLLAACASGSTSVPPTSGAAGETTPAAVASPTEAVAGGAVTEAVAPTATQGEAATEAVAPTAAEGGAATETVAPTATLPPNVAGGTRFAVVRGAMIDTMRKLADKYMQANPGKIITIEEEPEGGAFDALIAAGNQPDIITVSFGTQIGHYAASGVIIPLEDMDGAQDLFAKIDPATVQNLYGHNYYMPVGADVTMLIYNKDLFKEAGLDPEKPPTTTAEFLDYAAKIDQLPPRSDGTKVRGTLFWNDALSWGGWYWNMLQPMYLNFNLDKCQLLNKLGTDIIFDQPECKMVDFFDFNQKAQKFSPPTMEKNFFSRSIGMWPQYGYSWEPNLKEALGKPMVIGQDVGVAPVPVMKEGDTQYTTYGGRAYMIMKTTPERQQNAWDFVKFLMQDENNLQFLKELGYLPILGSLKSDPYFQEPARKPFVDVLQHAVMPEQYESADKVANAILGVYQDAAVKGSLSPEDAVTKAAEDARAALK